MHATSLSKANNQSSLTVTLVLVGAHLLLWLAFCHFLIVVVPRQEKTFRDYDMTVPDLTLTVLSAAHWANDNWLAAVAALSGLLGLDALVMVLLRRLAGWRKTAWHWFVLVSLLAILALAWETLGMLAVQLKALEGLSR
jgi:type II secretory pathway component PulF